MDIPHLVMAVVEDALVDAIKKGSLTIEQADEIRLAAHQELGCL